MMSRGRVGGRRQITAAVLTICVSAFAPGAVGGSGAAAASTTGKTPRLEGNAEAGRTIFNGKGVCSYCHGVDGFRAQAPKLEADTAALIARLNPPPADLRNAKSLKLKTDQARAALIREGHEGTGMFPDPTLTPREIRDLLAYLARLRREGSAASQGSAQGAQP